MNTGDGNDQALFDLSGLEGIATRDLTLNGLPVDGPVNVPVGYGIWDFANQTFLYENGGPITSPTENGAQTIMLDLPDYSNTSYEARPFKLKMELKLTVNPGANTGEGGVLDLTVTSVSNAANRSGKISITLDVQIVYELEFETEELETEMRLTYPDRLEYTLNFTNTGNTETEVLVFASDSFRGWNVLIESDFDGCDLDGSDFICDVDVGEVVPLRISVRPPFEMDIENEFKFTISIQPTETGVIDRENIEFEVLGVPSKGLLGLGLSEEQLQSGLFLLLGLPLLLLFYRVGVPTVQNSIETSRRGRKNAHIQQLIDDGHQGLSSATMKTRNPVPYRNPKSQFALSVVTLGIFGLIAYHQYSNEMKQHANVGKGGFQLWHLIFLIPPITIALPFWMLVRMFGFLRSVKELEARTGHATKLSFGFIFLWALIGMVVSVGSMIVLFFLPSFGSLDIIKTIVPAAAYMWTVFVTWKAFEDSLNTSWTLFFTRS
jgi:hypothetical protein